MTLERKSIVRKIPGKEFKKKCVHYGIALGFIIGIILFVILIRRML